MGSCMSTPQPSAIPPKVNRDTIDDTHFRRLRMIGRGGFGEVFIARRIPGKRDLVAIKRLDKRTLLRESYGNPATAVSGGYRTSACVWRERHAWADLKSPFLVELLHAFQDQDYLYLIMPLYAGGDLKHFVDNHGPIPEPILRFYMAEIVLALEALHAKNIVFRDMKPQNILLHESGHIALTDFGLCRPVPAGGDGITDLKDMVGTRGYQPPEQLSGRYSYPADFFALGVTIFRLLTCQRLFDPANRTFTRQIPIRLSYMAAIPHQKDNLLKVSFDKIPADDPDYDFEEVSALDKDRSLIPRHGSKRNLYAGSDEESKYQSHPSQASVTSGHTLVSSSNNANSGSPAPSRLVRTATGTSSVVGQRPSSFKLISTNGGVEDLNEFFRRRAPGEVSVSLSWEAYDLISQLVNIDPYRRLGTPTRPVDCPTSPSLGAMPMASNPRSGATLPMSPLMRSRTAPDGVPVALGLNGDPTCALDTVDQNDVEIEESHARDTSRNVRPANASLNRPVGHTRTNSKGGSYNPRREDDDNDEDDDYLDYPQVERLQKQFAIAFGLDSDQHKKDSAMLPLRRASRAGAPQLTRSNTTSSVSLPTASHIRGRDDQGLWRGLNAGFAQLKNHPFFAGLDWDAIAEKRVVPPIRPLYNMSRVRPLFPKAQVPKLSKMPEAAQILFRGFEYKAEVTSDYWAKSEMPSTRNSSPAPVPRPGRNGPANRPTTNHGKAKTLAPTAIPVPAKGTNTSVRSKH